jgi:hypothetical protein
MPEGQVRLFDSENGEVAGGGDTAVGRRDEAHGLGVPIGIGKRGHTDERAHRARIEIAADREVTGGKLDRAAQTRGIDGRLNGGAVVAAVVGNGAEVRHIDCRQ